MFDRLKLRLAEYALRRRKGSNKHAMITDTVGEYIDADAMLKYSDAPGYIDLHKNLMELPYSHLQVPFSEAHFLSWMVGLTGAKRVLELGTFRGFSTAFIARALPEGGTLLTIEKRPDQERIAKEYLDTYIEDETVSKIEFLEGDALEVLPALKVEIQNGKREQFDFIFIDADKAGNDTYLAISYDMLRPGGLIAIDNTLYGGMPAYEDVGNKEARLIRNFNTRVNEQYVKQSVLVPAWDGITFIHKK